jgi:hypothetical protein
MCNRSVLVHSRFQTERLSVSWDEFDVIGSNMCLTGAAVARWCGPTATPGTTGRSNSSTASTNAKRGEIGHSSKLGSACSNTELGASGTDFRIVAPPDPGSEPSPRSTMPPSNLDTVPFFKYQHRGRTDGVEQSKSIQRPHGLTDTLTTWPAPVAVELLLPIALFVLLIDSRSGPQPTAKSGRATATDTPRSR